MKIYTTYFAKIKNLPGNILPVSIASKAPLNFKGYEYKKLAPKWHFYEYYKNTGDSEFYTRCYNDEVLGNLNIKDVIQDLDSFRDHAGQDIALICYERPTGFCHRHLVARWLSSKGYHCEEYEY